MKTNKLIIWITLWVIALWIIVLIIFLLNQKQDNQLVVDNVEIDLQEETKNKYEEEIKKWDDMIKNFKPSKENTIMWTWVNLEEISNLKINPDFYIEKARYEEYLWRYKDAINTLNELLTIYDNSSVAWNNLWNIYEKIWKYDEAVKYYQKIIDTFPALKTYYYKKIVEIYIKLKDFDNASKIYIEYEKAGWNRDNDLVEKIKALK